MTLGILGVLSVLGVGAFLGLQVITAPDPDLAEVTSLLKEAAVVAETDQATLAEHCSSESGCWIWSVMARENCAAAVLRVGVADTADGVLRPASTRYLKVSAGTWFLVVEPKTSDSPAFADIESFTC